MIYECIQFAWAFSMGMYNTMHLSHLDIVSISNMGCGGALVETMTFNRRVVGSTPALAAT